MKSMMVPCPDCTDGFTTTGDRHARTLKDVCKRCGGDGMIDPDTGKSAEASAPPTVDEERRSRTLAALAGRSSDHLPESLADRVRADLRHSTPLGHSVIPDWICRVSYQQQSVLLLALRGPDGVCKHHPAKTITIAYRGTMLRAAARGRFLHWGEYADTFMALDTIADERRWRDALKEFFDHVDELPHHYVSHLAHAAAIIAHHHPYAPMRDRWHQFYAKWCDDLHVPEEPQSTMDDRLGDWGKAKDRLAQLAMAEGDRSQRPHETEKEYKARMLQYYYPGAWVPGEVSPPEVLYAWLLSHYEETDPTKGEAFRPVARKLVDALAEFIEAEMPASAGET